MSEEHQVVIHELPEGEELSAEFRLSVNGTNVPVYQTRVSAMPFNRRWEGT